MGMRAEIAIANPGDVNVTMTITMPLKDWITIRGSMELPKDHWSPEQQLSRAIQELTYKASKSFDYCGEAAPVDDDTPR